MWATCKSLANFIFFVGLSYIYSSDVCTHEKQTITEAIAFRFLRIFSRESKEVANPQPFRVINYDIIPKK